MTYDEKLAARIIESNIPEVWKDIADWEGLYAVSNFGRIKSYHRVLTNGKSRFIKQSYIMKTIASMNSDRRKINLQQNGFQQTCYINRLVAEAFLEINRKDDTIAFLPKNNDNGDNFVENLMIVQKYKVLRNSRRITSEDKHGNIMTFDSISLAADHL